MSLLNSSLVLTFARLTNYVVMLATPLLLVRMLDIETYGQYREFLLYSGVLISLFVLAIKENMIFVIPRYPAMAPAATTQTVGMLLATSALGSLIFVLGSEWFMVKASFDFALPLILYVFFFINFDVLENYWLAIQQPKKVLIFSTLRVLARVLIVLVATYVFRDLWSIIYAIVGFEIAKSALCLLLIIKLKLFSFHIDRDLLREQLRFIVPLSGAGLIYFINEKAGQLYISAAMGASALAIYTVGTYQLPITGVVRSAVADTLFPEMVKHAANGSHKGLELWKIANTYYCFLVFPAFLIFFVYADLFIVTLFTETYSEAANIFRVALLVMIRQCFEMGTPLRVVNANRYVLWGNVLAVLFHIPLLYVLTRVMGITGAALAWFIADMMIAMYLASRIMAHYKIGISELAYWPQLGKLVLCAICVLPILVFSEYLAPDSIFFGLAASFSFTVIFVILVKCMKIGEIDHLLDRLWGLAKNIMPGAKRQGA